MNHISIVFWLISPLSAIMIKTFDRYRFLVQTVYYVTPSYVDVVESNGRNTKICTVLENQKYGFVPGKDNFDCIEVSIHIVHRQQTS